MVRKRLIGIIELLFLFSLLIGFISASDEDISEKGVKYDKKIFESLNNDSLDKVYEDTIWFSIVVKIYDTSNVVMSKEDSIELQKAKDTERNNLMIKKTEDVLSTLSKDEFQLERKSEFGGSFSGNITKEGFEKLLKDKRVKKIYDNSVSGHVDLLESTQLINANNVWDSYDGIGQTVCVIDTGVNYSHPALGGCTQSQFLAGTCNKIIGGYDYWNGDSNPMDDNGHGTHVAGIITSSNSNNRGVANGSKIVALKSCDNQGDCDDSEAIISALQWCYNNRYTYNISIVSMSFGWSSLIGTCYYDFADDEISALYNAGITLIASSGNEGKYTKINYPACNDEVISVGAVYDSNIGAMNDTCTLPLFWGICLASCDDPTTFADKIACWGNRGSDLDLLAPGCQITSTNLSNGNFKTSCGTSMSAPMVAGAAAILLQKDPTLTPDEIQYTLQSTGVDIYDSETGLTFKRINVSAAINSLGCKCDSWSQVGGCGYSPCDTNENYYTRTCEDNCDIETKCEYSSSCEGVQSCTPNLCSGDYDDEGVGSPYLVDGKYWTLKRTCFLDDYCGSYGAWDYEYNSYSVDASDDGTNFYSPSIYTSTSQCYKFSGESNLYVNDWDPGGILYQDTESVNVDAFTNWNSNDECSGTQSSPTESATSTYTLGRGTGTSYSAGSIFTPYKSTSCGGGTAYGLEGDFNVYLNYQTATYYPEDYDYLYCDVPYTDYIDLDSAIYGDTDTHCDVEVQGSVSDPEEIKVKWYVNDDNVYTETCDSGGGDACNDNSGTTWGNNFVLANSYYSKGDEVKCIARGYGEDGGHGAYVESDEETVLNRIPTLSSVSLNKDYAKQNDYIQVTANSEADGDSDMLSLYCCNGNSCTPSISNHDFCYAVGDSYPYDLYCSGQGASGDGNQTVRCSIYDGESYSSIYSDMYIADNTNPSVEIMLPFDFDYPMSEVEFELHTYDLNNVSFCKYSLNDGLNYSMSNYLNFGSNHFWNATNSSMLNGNYSVRYYCNDSVGNINDTEIRNFSVNAPMDIYKFYHKNSAGENVAWFGNKGNIVLEGNCTAQPVCTPPANSFIIANSTDSTVAYIDSNGNLCVEKGDCSDSSSNCNNPQNAFIIKNSTNANVIYIDKFGDLCLTGKLYQFTPA